MKRNIITITDSRVVVVPGEVRMTISEIADLFGIFYQTAKKNIRAIEKSGIAIGDYSMGGTVEGGQVYPDYYGLEMIIAVAFRVQSTNSEAFRKWVMQKAIKQQIVRIPVLLTQNAMLN